MRVVKVQGKTVCGWCGELMGYRTDIEGVSHGMCDRCQFKVEFDAGREEAVKRGEKGSWADLFALGYAEAICGHQPSPGGSRHGRYQQTYLAGHEAGRELLH